MILVTHDYMSANMIVINCIVISSVMVILYFSIMNIELGNIPILHFLLSLALNMIEANVVTETKDTTKYKHLLQIYTNNNLDILTSIYTYIDNPNF